MPHEIWLFVTVENLPQATRDMWTINRRTSSNQSRRHHTEHMATNHMECVQMNCKLSIMHLSVLSCANDTIMLAERKVSNHQIYMRQSTSRQCTPVFLINIPRKSDEDRFACRSKKETSLLDARQYEYCLTPAMERRRTCAPLT